MIIRLVIFIAMATLAVKLCDWFPNAAMNPEHGVVMELPDRMPGLYGMSREMTDIEKYWLPNDTKAVKREYYPYSVSDPSKVQPFLTASIILSGSDKRSLHRPEVCLTGQGWTIRKGDSGVRTVETTGGPLDVMDLSLVRKVELEDGRKVKVRAHYYYWWVGRDVSTPHSWRRVFIATYNNVFRNVNDRWAYPSVMVYVPGNDAESDARARKLAETFIRDYAPTFQKSLGEQSS